MRKILVIGKSGQLGQAISKHEGPWSYRYLDRESLNLENRDTIAEVLNQHDFNILINAAAYTAVDRAEEEKDKAWLINAAAPEEMAKICHEKDALLIHISTDYVFGEDTNRPLQENDEVNPVNHYGVTKLRGEEAIRKHAKKHIILRTSWLYGLTGKNFPKTMLDLSSKRDDIQVVYDQVGNPTFADDLAVTIREICDRDDEEMAYGTFHYSNEGVCSWYDFAIAIFDLNRRNVRVTPVTSEAFPTAAKRPPYSVLNKKKIKDTFGIEIRHWRTALAEFCEQLPK